MERNAKAISQQGRLEEIRTRLARAGEVSVAALAKEFAVSEMTVRRDVAVLEEQGEVVRTHGGAASARRLTFEFTFRSRQHERVEQKRAIAAKAAESVRDGQAIILDTGTTTLAIARALRDRRDLRVITTSLAIVSELQFSRGIRTILLGGFLREGSPDLHGPLTEQNLSGFSADQAFMGADAIDADGAVYTDDLSVVNLDRTMAKVSGRMTIVADSSKLSRRAMCRILRAGEYGRLITDWEADEQMAKKLAKCGVEVIRAPRSRC